MKKQPIILLHKDELKNVRVEIKPVFRLDETIDFAHRDDHYLFIIQQQGNFSLELDFNTYLLRGPSVCFITPGQVHRYMGHKNSRGWLIFIDSEFISNPFREIFDSHLHTHQSIVVGKKDASFNIVPILQEALGQKSSPIQYKLIKSLTEALIGGLALKIAQSQTSGNIIGGQKYNLVIRFKQLVMAEYKNLKAVSVYASSLSVTPPYLNEVVKKITGFPASHWINQEILLEGKRILYYTDLDVKQIAYELGYEDPAYFSRFFKKIRV